MSIEIEAKMKVPSHDAVRAHLRQLHAEILGSFAETNVFFDTDDRALLAGDKGLRIRRNHNVDRKLESIVVTFKGPRTHGQLKSRQEIEVTVTDFDNAAQLLESLGFHNTLTFEKKRESWKLDGCKVELDLLPFLGTYVEIEGENEATILSVRQKLDLAQAPLIKSSYSSLLLSHLQETGDKSRVIRFP